MYLIISALFFILNSQSTKLQSNMNSTKNYHLNINEDTILLQFPRVIDAKLYTNNTEPFCTLIEKNVAFYIKQLQMLENNEINEQVDNQVYPFNLKQFICMTQIQDGIIALTTDFILYFFELNYDAIQSNTNNQFAKKIWTTDFKPIIPDSEQMIDFAQVVFSVTSSQALIIFNSSAYILDLKQDKTKMQSLDVINVGDWVSRSTRGLTKSIDEIIFTCVGEYGIDIYKSAFNSLRFLGNLDKTSLELDQFNLKDFTLIKLKELSYKCYFLDFNGNVYVIEIDIINYEFTFQLVTQISSQGQGISIDTKNGINVFVAYSSSHLYQVIEYYISLNQSIYFELNSYKTRNSIKSLDATDEFVIIQGINHHKILFRSDVLQQQSLNLPVFTYVGLRDFEIFQLQSDIKSSFKGVEIFVGITSTNLFLAKFYIQPYELSCYTEQTEQFNSNSALLTFGQFNNLFGNRQSC
ncbi:unnamed protein product (macronuclear) [Paramecium tetraurelia]|uniref:Transmembrane protein n=1 Tax=Paramecium tetraurelia TaxID=5888 RepID=A0BUR5_PARTE|nr:uncharacterized protein GSPATT00005528001 [Paramecium tetraurelia]CAK62282.1 unnamed protein product [Paramecium tetraurelia]|eukprot:XP_001429680.1 hypothetical protein (macronuclear) [Paramecium tetraurelia strain d4-2]